MPWFWDPGFRDLTITGGVAALFGAALVADVWAPLRFAIAVVFVFFGPGYAFVAALFPSWNPPSTAAENGGAEEPFREAAPASTNPTWLERLVLSVLVGLTMILAAAFVSSRATGALSFGGVTSVLLVSTAVALAVAAWRRLHVPAAERPRLALEAFPSVRRLPTGQRMLAAGVLVVVLVLAAVMATATLAPRTASTTEFFLTDDGGVSFGTEDLAPRGATQSLFGVVSNREGTSLDFMIRVVAAGPDGSTVVLNETDAFAVASGEIHRRQITYPVSESMKEAQVLLFKAGSGDPYRSAVIRYPDGSQT